MAQPVDEEDRLKRIAESKISAFISDQLLADQVETGFNLFLKHRPDLKESNFENSEAEFFNVLQVLARDFNNKGVDEGIKAYVRLGLKVIIEIELKEENKTSPYR